VNPSTNAAAISQSSKRITMKLDIPSDIMLIFEEELLTLNIDCFDLFEGHKHLILPYLIEYLFDQHQIYSKLQIDPVIVHRFGERIALGYKFRLI